MPRNLLTGGIFGGRLFAELVSTDEPTPSFAAGSMIGVWRILRLLGRGGMSEVYLAERCNAGFAQTVAVKVIAAGVDAPELLREERRILGRLSHPGIATLIDGGELECGRVWLAMEYVDGEPIDVHAETRALGWMARVALVEQLCEAVGHAHRHLLVHRDIKPSNVLVDADGHAKLIDFGIAVAEHAVDPAQRWLTPGFAAPEQIDGGDITTATDLFQLGQLLRSLTAADVLPAALPAASARDLERIIARATREHPAQRHASAAELAAELAALRGLRPLPGGRSPRMQRWRLWRLRHAWASWVAVPVLLTIAASAVLAAQSAVREADERAMALREEQVSTAIGSFFIDLFNEPVPAEGAAGGVTALLDRGQRRLLARPDSNPRVQAALLHQLALANVQMERRDMAVELLDEAIRVQRHAGLSSPLANSLAALARLRTLAGDAGSATRLGAEAAALLARERRLSRDRFLALTQLGDYYLSSFAFTEAEQVLRAALQVGTQRYGADSPELYRSQRLLLGVLQNQWLIDQAEPVAEALASACRRQFGADDSRCVTDFIQWQRTRAMAGDPEDARRSLEALWAQRGDWDGQFRHYREHAVLFGLSDVHAIAGDRLRSLDTVLASLCPLEKAEGRGGDHWISDRGGLALLLVELGAPALALAVSAEARERYAESPSLEGAFWAMRHARIELAATGTVAADSEARLLSAIERFRTVYGTTSYFTARAELALAQIEAARGDAEAALALADRAARARPQGLRFYHPQLLAEIDTLRADLNTDPEPRIALLRQAEDRLRAAHGEPHPLVAAAHLRRAQAESGAGRPVDRETAEQALHVLAAQQVSGSPEVERALRWLASLGIPLPPLPAGRALLDADPPCVDRPAPIGA